MVVFLCITNTTAKPSFNIFKCLAWFPDSRTFAFSQETSKVLHLRRVVHNSKCPENFKLVEYAFDEFALDPANITLGGNIRLVQVSPNGNIVLLAFEGREPGKELVVVCVASFDPTPQLKHV